MRLAEIIDSLSLARVSSEFGEIEISNVCAHSHECTPNCIFVCLDGYKDSGQRYIAEAIELGARVVVVRQRQDLNAETCQIISDNTRKSGAEIARVLYAKTLEQLRFVFVTGTKGKTTTANLLSYLLCSSGIRTATVGTLGIDFEEYHESTRNTTPDLFYLLPRLERLREMGAKYVVLEVSSQALKDHRIDSLAGEMAIFTGLSADHIDPLEHATFLEYALCKRRLFFDFCIKEAFAPLDSPIADWMLFGARKQYFVDTKRKSDLTLKIKEMSKSGVFFTDGNQDGFLSLTGEFNLKNAALAILCASKISGKPCAFFYPFLCSFRLSGRLEILQLHSREVVIDYAHNAQSIREIGKLFRSLTKGRLIAVIGTVGDRARGRRRALSRACEECFDLTVLTEDDTVSEPPENIVTEMYSYFKKPARAICVLRRDEAIRKAFSLSEPHDTILLLGKGHECSLLRQGVRVPFDERSVLMEIKTEKCGKI